MCFIKDHHTVGDIVQFPASAGFCGVQRFEELNVGRHNDRGIPIFRSEPGTLGFFFRFHVAMVLDNVCLTEYFHQRVGCLLNDAGIRDNINDAPFLMVCGVVECEEYCAPMALLKRFGAEVGLELVINQNLGSFSLRPDLARAMRVQPLTEEEADMVAMYTTFIFKKV